MKINYLLSAAIAVVSLGMTGCSQSEDVAENTTTKQTITFASGEDETTTRTSMGGKYTDASFPFYWEAGDAIWVNAADKITGSNAGTASYALFTGSVSTSAPYKIRYTGTGSYNTTNSRTNTTVNTTSNANTLVIPPVQSIATWAEGAATSRIGANGDCGTATATGSGTSYSFKLAHKAAYLIIMPRWEGEGTGNYMLKSVTVSTHDNDNLLSGRFKFDDNGIGDCIYTPENPTKQTNGSRTIKVVTGGTSGLLLPADKTEAIKYSINIAIKPVTASVPLYCTYEVYDTNSKNTYYIEKIIGSTTDGGTLTADKSFAANTITPITANIYAGYDLAVKGGYLDLITNKNPYSCFYEWDVPNGEEYFVSHEMGDDYNATPVTASTFPTAAEGARTDWCTNSNFKALPTYNQITWYIKGGCYWDANKVWGPGTYQKGGMWFKKKAKIIADEITGGNSTFDENVFNTTQSGMIVNYTTTKPTDFSESDWFFLPATGYNSSVLQSGSGDFGIYWSSTPARANNRTYYLNCSSTKAAVESYYRRYTGFRLWSAQ